MVYETFERVYGEQYADIYLKELILMGKEKIRDLDETLILQRVLELQNDEEY